MSEFDIGKEDLLNKRKMNNYRKLFAYGLRRFTDMKIRDIGQIMNMDYSALSELVNRFVKEGPENGEIRVMIHKFHKAAKLKLIHLRR